MKVAIISLLASLLFASFSNADPTEHSDAAFRLNHDVKECTAFLKAKTAELVPDLSSITTYNFLTKLDNGFGDVIASGYEGWISFNNCKGNLVITVNRHCQYIQSYTRGSCSIEGLKNY